MGNRVGIARKRGRLQCAPVSLLFFLAAGSVCERRSALPDSNWVGPARMHAPGAPLSLDLEPAVSPVSLCGRQGACKGHGEVDACGRFPKKDEVRKDYDEERDKSSDEPAGDKGDGGMDVVSSRNSSTGKITSPWVTKRGTPRCGVLVRRE